MKVSLGDGESTCWPKLLFENVSIERRVTGQLVAPENYRRGTGQLLARSPGMVVDKDEMEGKAMNLKSCLQAVRPRKR